MTAVAEAVFEEVDHVGARAAAFADGAPAIHSGVSPSTRAIPAAALRAGCDRARTVRSRVAIVHAFNATS